MSGIVYPVREVRDEVSSNTECHHGYQEHHHVVNHQVGEVTFFAMEALVKAWIYIFYSTLTVLSYPADDNSASEEDDGDETGDDEVPGYDRLTRATCKLSVMRVLIVITRGAHRTAQLYDGAVDVDDPRTERVNEVSVSVERAKDDHSQGEEDSEEYQENDQPGCLTGIVHLSRL